MDGPNTPLGLVMSNYATPFPVFLTIVAHLEPGDLFLWCVWMVPSRCRHHHPASLWIRI
eukprot:COSAG04_NODE_6732_length_1267_cov_1.455479_1_plen_59_part_00